MGNSGHPRLPLIVAALLLVTDFSLAANALVQVPEDVEYSGEGLVAPLPNMPPPLMCGDVECPEKNRMPGFRPADSGPPVEDPCLLYTSPSPRDKRQSRMPSSA